MRDERSSPATPIEALDKAAERFADAAAAGKFEAAERWAALAFGVRDAGREASER